MQASLTPTTDLTHHLLCAVPQMTDPNFQHAAVLLLDHNEEGAFGLVLNNPLKGSNTGDILGSLGLQWCGHDEKILRYGGPVERMRGFVLHDREGWDPLAEELFPGLWLTTSLDAVIENGRNELGGDDSSVVFLLGYAGWGPGQLEGEMTAGGWVAVPIAGVTSPVPSIGLSPQRLLAPDSSDLWKEALASIGIDPGRLISGQTYRA